VPTVTTVAALVAAGSGDSGPNRLLVLGLILVAVLAAGGMYVLSRGRGTGPSPSAPSDATESDATQTGASRSGTEES
jgi:hypothetical protein